MDEAARLCARSLGRQLYAEIASVEEQHVTQYESIIDAGESWLEKLLLMQATEVYNDDSCVESEKNPRVARAHGGDARGAEEFAPDLTGDEGKIAAGRSANARAWDERIGSVPPATSVKGMLTT